MEMLLWGWVYPALLVLIFATSGVLLWQIIKALGQPKLELKAQAIWGLLYFAAFKGLFYSGEFLEFLSPHRMVFLALTVWGFLTFYVLTAWVGLRHRHFLFIAMHSMPLFILGLSVGFQTALDGGFLPWMIAPHFSDQFPNVISDVPHRKWLEGANLLLPEKAYGFQTNYPNTTFAIPYDTFKVFLKQNKLILSRDPEDIFRRCRNDAYPFPNYCLLKEKPAAIVLSRVLTKNIQPSIAKNEDIISEAITVSQNGSVKAWVYLYKNN